MKHIKTILALVSMLVFGQGAWAQYFVKNTGVEDGTEDYPFLIKTVADLKNLAEDVNSGHSHDGEYFKLTDDLSFPNEYSYTPIGYGDESGGKAFKGIFDGGGHTISNITCYLPESAGVGLFGYIYYPAVIKNVKMDNCTFTGNTFVGAIVGSSAGGGSNEWGVFNCTVGTLAEVSVTATKATIENEEWPGTYAGGIIGYSHCLTVRNCYSAATVTGDQYVGAIAGYMLGSTAQEAIIDECYFAGDVRAVGGRGYEDEQTDGATDGIINITLYDNDESKNADRLSNYNGETVNVTLSGRTLYKDTKWNTLCLPFAISDFTTDTPLKDATAMKLSTSSFDDGTLELNFESLNKLEAGQPCLVKWASGTNISDPTFHSVIINNTTNDAQTTYADLKGSFSTVGLAGLNMGVLYLGADNKLYTPSSEKFTIGAFRAYFQLKGINAPYPYSAEAKASRFVMNFGEGKITSINEELRMKNEESAGAWYDLQGRKLNDEPKHKGIYINNGKRIVIK